MFLYTFYDTILQAIGEIVGGLFTLDDQFTFRFEVVCFSEESLR